MAIPGGLGFEEVIIDYTYDPLNRLTAADYSDGTYFYYQYDAVGNRLQLDSSQDGVVTYQYDAANRLIEAGGVSYTWDPNGNLLSDGTSTYSYNYANRLAGVTQDGVTYTYVYNGRGDRLQQSIDGVTTNYTLDINTNLTQVLADGTHIFLYGRGRIAQVSSAGPEYFLGDALGSVRQVANPAAEAVLSRSYQPYGEVLSQHGGNGTPYGFTGEWTDRTGLVHLRARYYDAGQGRFLTKDVWQGKTHQPMSYNNWLYVYANPLVYVDPSGYQGECPECTPIPPPHPYSSPNPTTPPPPTSDPTITPGPYDESEGNSCDIDGLIHPKDIRDAWILEHIGSYSVVERGAVIKDFTFTYPRFSDPDEVPPVLEPGMHFQAMVIAPVSPALRYLTAAVLVRDIMAKYLVPPKESSLRAGLGYEKYENGDVRYTQATIYNNTKFNFGLKLLKTEVLIKYGKLGNNSNIYGLDSKEYYMDRWVYKDEITSFSLPDYGVIINEKRILKSILMRLWNRSSESPVFIEIGFP